MASEKEKFLTIINEWTARKLGIDTSISRRTRLQRQAQESYYNTIQTQNIKYKETLEL